ncbi:MAG TPA: GGDEF domain-containing protein [Steroidobacteraceae bacterium]|nr:GGDEF domain-containing protein [Steroidobacteraceae bacterium]
MGKQALIALCVAALALLPVLYWSLRSRLPVRRDWLDQRKPTLVRHDVLTGLPNRRHLERVLPKLLARARRNGTRLALLGVRLDHLGNGRDSSGYGSADELLTTLAHRLRDCVAGHDVVVRLGGEEFLVVATLLPDAHGVSVIADRIRMVLQAPLEVGGASLSVTPRIGISLYPEDASDPEQLLRHAETFSQGVDDGRTQIAEQSLAHDGRGGSSHAAEMGGG